MVFVGYYCIYGSSEKLVGNILVREWFATENNAVTIAIKRNKGVVS